MLLLFFVKGEKTKNRGKRNTKSHDSFILRRWFNTINLHLWSFSSSNKNTLVQEWLLEPPLLSFHTHGLTILLHIFQAVPLN